MPPLIPPLREDLAYIHCPLCRDAGGPSNVPLRRNTNLNLPPFVCSLNPLHQFTFAQLQGAQAEMTPMSAVLQETPNPLAMRWQIWVMPKTKELLEQKWSGRLLTTIGTFLDLLAEDALLLIQGSEAVALRKRGLQNGSQILAALDSIQQLEKERQDALEKLKRMNELLREAGMEG